VSWDPLKALRVLLAHDVRFVVIGGFAGRLWGSPSVTNDLDVCYDRAPDNLERLAAALRELRAELRGITDVLFALDADSLAEGMNFPFTTSAGALDLLGRPAGVLAYADLVEAAVELDLGRGLAVPVADLDDLIELKRAAARPKDLIEVEVLEAVRTELRR
jgi:hypothetical protein